MPEPSIGGRHWLVASAATTPMTGASIAQAQEEAPFGDEASVAHAERVYDEALAADLVGDNAVRSYPYEGREPHGMVLEQIETRLTVDDGIFIVESNYVAEGLTVDDVLGGERAEHLVATTMMFQREAGYAPDSDNWYWAKFLPNGELDGTPNDLPLAGRVQGCIGRLVQADGGDCVYLHGRFAAQ